MLNQPNSQQNASIHFQSGACNSHSTDLSIGCDHNCVYCYFSAEQKAKYKREQPKYRGETILLNIEELLKQEEYPAQLYLSYATDAFAPKVKASAHLLLERILPKGVKVLLITKGTIPDETIELLDQYGDQVSVEIGLSSLSEERRKLIEPGTAKSHQRLDLMRKLSETSVAYVCARIDPIFPGIDDDEDDLKELIGAIKETGVKNLVASYLVLSRGMRQKLTKKRGLEDSMNLMNTEISITGGQKKWCIEPEIKRQKLSYIAGQSARAGLSFHTCICKDSSLAGNGYSTSCHPGDSDSYVLNEKSTMETNKLRR